MKTIEKLIAIEEKLNNIEKLLTNHLEHHRKYTYLLLSMLIGSVLFSDKMIKVVLWALKNV